VDLDFENWWIYDMLQRSQSVPLSCGMYVPRVRQLAKRKPRIDSAFLEAVISFDLHRISVLKIHFSSRNMAKNILCLLFSPKHALKELEPAINGKLDHELLPVLPGHVLTGCTLIYLSLSNVYLPLWATPLSELKRLVVSLSSDHQLSSGRPSFTQLSSLLSNFPCLKR
jgi:hypothetical protein